MPEETELDRTAEALVKRLEALGINPTSIAWGNNRVGRPDIDVFLKEGQILSPQLEEEIVGIARPFTVAEKTWLPNEKRFKTRRLGIT